ncbi:MAG: hypothetical protein IKE63_04505 [Bacilli bacterium]|nr:hypothetical protein [Bacilli bacterium]
MINVLYIDPSVMTYTIQVITGIVVALGAIVGVFIKKFKKKVKIKDKNKEKESDDISIK